MSITNEEIEAAIAKVGTDEAMAVHEAIRRARKKARRDEPVSFDELRVKLRKRKGDT